MTNPFPPAIEVQHLVKRYAKSPGLGNPGAGDLHRRVPLARPLHLPQECVELSRWRAGTALELRWGGSGEYGYEHHLLLQAQSGVHWRDCLDSPVVALPSTSKECLVDQEEIERDDEPGDNTSKYRRQPRVHQLSHYIFAPGEQYKRDKGKRNTKAEDHLA
jgi:hypothetical protein